MTSHILDQTAAGMASPSTGAPTAVSTSTSESALVYGPVKACAELAAEANRLARILRIAPSFTTALGAYLGMPLRREPRAPDSRRHVVLHDAVLLDVEPGIAVLYRDGWLVPRIEGAALRAAAITALVHEGRLGLNLSQREALHRGELPLSVLLRDAHRSTHYAFTVATTPEPEHPALHVRATLLLGGRPVALVRESVYWQVITRRNHLADLSDAQRG